MAVEVKPVAGRSELKAFIKLPWRLYRNEPNWVAPLLMDLRKRLDQRKNPFFKHATVWSARWTSPPTTSAAS